MEWGGVGGIILNMSDVIEIILKISCVGSLNYSRKWTIPTPTSPQNSLIRLLTAKERDRARAAFLKLDQDKDGLITRAEWRQAQQSWFHKLNKDSQSCSVRWVRIPSRSSRDRPWFGFHSRLLCPLVQYKSCWPHLWEQPNQPGGGAQQTRWEQVCPLLDLSLSLGETSILDKVQRRAQNVNVSQHYDCCFAAEVMCHTSAVLQIRWSIFTDSDVKLWEPRSQINKV